MFQDNLPDSDEPLHPSIPNSSSLLRSSSVPVLTQETGTVGDEWLGRGQRKKTQRERGISWQLDRAHQHYMSAVSSWRKKVTKLECMLDGHCEPEFLQCARAELWTAMDCIYKAFEEIDITGGGDIKLRQKQELIEEENLDIVKRVSRCIRSFADDSSSIVSSLKSKTGASRSGVTRISHRSNVSSNASSENLAALKVKLKHSLLEEQKKQELLRIKSELGRIRLQEEI